MSSIMIDPNELNNIMYHNAFEIDSDMQKWDGGCWIRYKMFENAMKEVPKVDWEIYTLYHKLFHIVGIVAQR